MQSIQEKLQKIVCDQTLSPQQKARYLSLEAENMLPYPSLDTETTKAFATGVLCDLVEGHAPYKPRYVLPDYSVVLTQGSEYLELEAPVDLDEAINCLMIAYHHVPSVTGMPVYIGHLDQLLLPFCEGVTDDQLYRKIKLFWRYLDRTLPDAFMHANIGPQDNPVARAILRVDAELQQIAPNLTFCYDPDISSDAILKQATDNIIACSKPHIANHPLHQAAFDEKGYGIVSCYNALPVAGGAGTLVRLNLKEVALRSTSVTDFLTQKLPYYSGLCFRLIESRMGYLFEQSNFFDSFLVQEGWIDTQRFTAMYGIYGMAEAVNLLQDMQQSSGRYGHDAQANELGYQISQALAQLVGHTPVKHAWRGRAMLHSQAGISSDVDVTPGVRIPYGAEPDPVTHIQALLPHHRYYDSGISEILTLEETIKNNPQALFTLCKGALAAGFREFTANVDSNDLVRVTGYMVRLSDIALYNQQQGSRTNTTVLGAEAAAGTHILERKPRVVSHEISPSYG